MSLSFEFSEEQEKFRKEVAGFARAEIQPTSAFYDEQEEFPWEWFQKMAQMGLTAFTYPPELGGRGQNYVTLGIAIEELGKVDLTASTICSYINVYPKIPGLPEDLVRDVIQGRKLLSFGETEANAGADAANIQTTARRVADGYVIDGVKLYASHMPAAQYIIITAKTAPELRGKGISLFLLPTDLPGISASLIRIPGRKAHMLGKVAFDNVKVPSSSLIGEENKAFKIIRGRWDYSRCNVGLMCIGAAEQTLSEIMQYAKKRQTFGSPLAKWESIQFRIVDNYTAIEAARWLAYRALWMYDQGKKITKEASMIKIFATEAALKTMIDAHMIHGASGLNMELPLEKRHRDVMSLYITGGGVDVHKIVVGGELLGQEFVPYR